MDNIYYTYIYLDPRKPGIFEYNDLSFNYEPFYVGKGKNKRMNRHLYCYDTESNKYKNSKIKKILELGLTPIIVLLKENLVEKDALDLEIKTIASIGRFKYENIFTHKIGPLVNLTDGGESTSGHKHTEESKLKMSISQKKRCLERPETIIRGKNHPGFGKPSPRKGCVHTKETKELLSKIQLGKTYIDKVGEEKAKEWRINIGKSNIGKKHPHSKETKDLLSKIQLGKSYADKVGEEKAIEWIEKIRKSNTGKKRTQDMKDNMSGINNPMYGKTHTKDARLKMSESMTGRIPWNKGKVVLKFTLDNEFIDELFLDTLQQKIKPNVVQCCRGDRKTAGGFIWKYKITK